MSVCVCLLTFLFRSCVFGVVLNQHIVSETRLLAGDTDDALLEGLPGGRESAKELSERVELRFADHNKVRDTTKGWYFAFALQRSFRLSGCSIVVCGFVSM